MGEHLPYKQRVIGSSPILSTKKEIGSFVSNIEGWLEGEAVQSELPVDVRDRGRPSAQFARDRAPLKNLRKQIKINLIYLADRGVEARQ